MRPANRRVSTGGGIVDVPQFPPEERLYVEEMPSAEVDPRRSDLTVPSQCVPEGHRYIRDMKPDNWVSRSRLTEYSGRLCRIRRRRDRAGLSGRASSRSSSAAAATLG